MYSEFLHFAPKHRYLDRGQRAASAVNFAAPMQSDSWVLYSPPCAPISGPLIGTYGGPAEHDLALHAPCPDLHDGHDTFQAHRCLPNVGIPPSTPTSASYWPATPYAELALNTKLSTPAMGPSINTPAFACLETLPFHYSTQDLLPDRPPKPIEQLINARREDQGLFSASSAPSILPITLPERSTQFATTKMVVPPKHLYPLAASHPAIGENQIYPKPPPALEDHTARPLGDTPRIASESTLQPCSTRDLSTIPRATHEDPPLYAPSCTTRTYAQAAATELLRLPTGPMHVVSFATRSSAPSASWFDQFIYAVI